MRVLAVVEAVSIKQYGAPFEGLELVPAEAGSMLRLDVTPALAAPGQEFYLIVKLRTQAILGV